MENVPCLTPLPRKLELLGHHGLDFTCVVAFDQTFAAQSPEAFVEDFLHRQLDA